MNRKNIFVSLAAFSMLLSGLAPGVADAGLVPCGGTGQPQCSLCHIVSGIGDLTTYIRDIMVFVALAVITAMGIMYIVSSGNTGMMETAKKGVWAALAGVAIVLFAWVIVNTIMYSIFRVQEGDVAVLKSFSFTTGFVFDCDATLAGVGSLPAGAASGAPSGPAAGAMPSVPGVPAAPSVGGTPAVPAAPSSFVLCGVGSLAIGDKTKPTLWKSAPGMAIGCSDTSRGTDVTADAVAWRSSDPTRAIVSASGEVTAKNQIGNVVISATPKDGAEQRMTILIFPSAVKDGVFGICQKGATPAPVGSTLQLSVWRQDSGLVSCRELAEAKDVTGSCSFKLENPQNGKFVTIGAKTGKVTVKDGPAAVTIVATCAIPTGSKSVTTSVLTTK